MQQGTKQPPGVTVDGREYPLPTFESITLDEERLMYLYADCVIRDFIPPHPDLADEEKEAYRRLQLIRWRDPNFKKALVAIALRRAHPDMTHEDRDAKAGSVRGIEADIAMLWADDDDPPAESSQKQPEPKRSTSETSSSTDSGSNTTSGSDPAGESRETTGTSESDTSSPGAPPIALAS
jgi:hypothetical protein